MPAAANEPRPALIAVVALLLGAVLTGGWMLATQNNRAEPRPAAPASPEQQLAAIVDEQPENVEARRRLGDLHFAEDRFDAALEQYLVVLDAFPQQAQTLARAGWIAFEGGDSATGERLVTESLAIARNDAEALWYLAQIRMYGLDDGDGAVAPLRRLLQRDDLSAQLRRDARRLLATARR
jgi:tetratricopeptide (TPR) repeat protein